MYFIRRKINCPFDQDLALKNKLQRVFFYFQYIQTFSEKLRIFKTLVDKIMIEII